MRTIGITGRSGCGKSSVSAYLTKLGYCVQDGDKVSREILQPGSLCLPLLARRFGADILDDAGRLNRRLLADRAFLTPEGTQALTDITFPEICRRLYEEQRRQDEQGSEFFFLDGAVIVGTALQEQCDAIILVEAPLDESVRRICARDGISQEMALRRLNAQLSVEELRAACRYRISNDGDLPQLYAQVDDVLNQLRKESHEATS